MSSIFIHVTAHDKFSSFLREYTEIFFADQQRAQVYPNHFLQYHDSKFSSKPSSDSDSQDSSNSVLALVSRAQHYADTLLFMTQTS